MSNASAAYLVSHEPRASCSGQGSARTAAAAALQLCAAERKQAHGLGHVPRRRDGSLGGHNALDTTASVSVDARVRAKKLRGVVLAVPLLEDNEQRAAHGSPASALHTRASSG